MVYYLLILIIFLSGYWYLAKLDARVFHVSGIGFWLALGLLPLFAAAFWWHVLLVLAVASAAIFWRGVEVSDKTALLPILFEFAMAFGAALFVAILLHFLF